MPIVDRRGALTPANMRNADVAHRLIEDIAPMQQSRMQSAFRVAGVQAVLYTRLTQGRPCICHRQNNEASRLSPDGKASSGAIDRIITGNSNFGIGSYSTHTRDLNENPYKTETSPGNQSNKYRGDLNRVGSILDDEFNQLEEEPILGDNGQFSPDLEDMFDGFDMSQLGLSDISCPICFGTNYVGGFSPFRSWRQVLLGTDLRSTSYFDLPSFTLSPGVHYANITLPRGATVLDVCRTMNGKTQTLSQMFVDGVDITRSRFLDFCDGRPRVLRIETDSPLTHVEIQLGLSDEPVFFEFPKKSKSSDMSLLEQTDPFQIIVSPDIPSLAAMDVIMESQSGKLLIVQATTPWSTRNKNMLGFECQVRVAQPQELWNILPKRRHVTGQKRVLGASPSKARPSSGLANTKGFSF